MVDSTSPKFVTHIIIAALILLGNTLVIYLYFTDRLLQKTSNIFVISLAFCDLLIALVFIPCHEFFGDLIEDALRLRVSGYVASIASYGSLLNLAALTYDRYIAIFHSLRYHAIMTDRKVVMMMTFIWTVDLIVTLLPLSWNFVSSPEDNLLYLHVYQTILIIIIILTLLAITLVYFKIFMVNRHHLEAERENANRFRKQQSELQIEHVSMEADAGSENRASKIIQRLYNSRAVTVEMKAARVVMLMFFINLICWLPTVLLNAIYLVSWFRNKPNVPQLLMQISSYSFLAYSVVNPWIYALLKEDFRRSFKRKLCRRD